MEVYRHSELFAVRLAARFSVCISLANSWRGENIIYLVVKQCKTAVFLPYRPFVVSFQRSKASVYLAY